VSFVTIYGETPTWIWVESIATLTDEQARNKLLMLAEQARDYPANLTEFMRVGKPPGVRYLGSPINPRALAYKPQVNRELADRTLASCRRSLRGRSCGP
jgi:hypothetical protein